MFFFWVMLFEVFMWIKLKVVDNNLSKKCFYDWIFLRLLFIFERGIFWLLYIIFMMESDEVFVNEELKFWSLNFLGKYYREFKILNSDYKDRIWVIFVFYMLLLVKNLVKDFILNIVNRKNIKKWVSLKWFVIMENVMDEKVVVRYVGRGYLFVLCYLWNFIWCDCCGEFIWGFFK